MVNPMLLAADGSQFDTSAIWWIVIIVAAVVALVFFLVIGQFIGLWIQAFFASANISMFELIGMRMRKVNARVVVESKIQAVKAGLLNISTNDIESHYLAGGHVVKVVRAMIAANRAGIPLDWKQACAIDLAGRDIFDAVQTSVNPKVIDVPNPSAGRTTIDAVAKDGIQLKAKARVTRPHEHAAADRRSDGRNDHRSRRRRHRHDDRLVRHIQASAGEPRPHQQGGPAEGPGRRLGL